MTIFISAVISFFIACLGWYLLEKRVNRTSKRSETFSLITPLISILNDFEDMAEEQLHAHLDATISDKAKKKLLGERLVFSIKSLSKFNLLRSRLILLNDRNITISDCKLIELKQSLTMNNIDDASKYQVVINSCQSIQLELYNAFERKYK